MNKIKPIVENQLKKDLPEFSAGDTVAIDVRVIEGGKERVQKFEGLVIGRKGSDVSATFTVRKISGGIGVERIFPVHSPMISKITVKKKGKVRRAKLNYMRKLTGAKAIRIAEKK
ncbi:MAG: 50S ribosomal protein L19 [Candidatus Marinimicrobia bacterium]|nr:50S ribosomal protein L19 [Candidatus Neomarinimicrobiota bacterium]|tara:strand:- start:97 stop:441 length:345 start_codon:yes stop_codon:yes gene_type:complete